MKHYYGVANKEQIKNMVEHVCEVLGHGSNYRAYEMLMETAAAETQMGLYQDTTPNGAGYGLTQFDRIGFEDVQQRTRQKDAAKVANAFGFNIFTVELDELAHNPLLALIFTRLKYKLRPEPIPISIIERADYWKRFWNTKAGKGTAEHYIESTKRHLLIEGEYYA